MFVRILILLFSLNLHPTPILNLDCIGFIKRSLQQQSLNESYTAGENKLPLYQQLSHELRLNFIRNRSEDYIPSLRTEVSETVEKMLNAALAKHNFLPEKYRILSQEAQSVIDNEELTYEWWMLFNLRSILLFEDDFASKTDIILNHQRFKNELISANGKINFEYKSHFLELLESREFSIIATVGHIGIQPLTTLNINRTFPIGITHSQIRVDGTDYSPLEFFIHDVRHIVDILDTINNTPSLLPLLSNLIHSSTLTFSNRQKRLFFFALFLLFHETPSSLKAWVGNSTRPELYDELSLLARFGFKDNFVSDFADSILTRGIHFELLPPMIDFSNQDAIEMFITDSLVLFERVLLSQE